jgi:hypothetical protein
MTGSCWRLLAAFLLSFATPSLLRGQDATVDHPLAVAPALGPNSAPLRHSSPIAPVSTLPPSTPPRYPVAPGTLVPPGLVFQHLVRGAGIIFSGQVTSIGRVAPSAGQYPASTTVTFQVENALRGAAVGEELTIHEWAGLRSSGERYYVGERVLLFLYSPSRLGLTSPVAGAMGRFAVDSQDRVVMSAQHRIALAADPILGGKTIVSYAAFARAVRRTGGEE